MIFDIIRARGAFAERKPKKMHSPSPHKFKPQHRFAASSAQSNRKNNYLEGGGRFNFDSMRNLSPEQQKKRHYLLQIMKQKPED